MKNFSILAVALICVLGASACTASEKEAYEKPPVAGEQHTAAENKSESNKTKENKAAEKAQTKTVELFDGRKGKINNNKLSEVDLALVEKDMRKKAEEDFLKKRLGDLGKNIDWKEDFLIQDVAEGAFTESGSNQRAVLYRFSYTNGLVILADGEIVAHFSGGPGDYAFYTAIKSLPDVNQNGLSEIILFRNVEDNEDVIPYLFEANGNAVKFLGEGEYFRSGYVAGDDTDQEKVLQNAYRLTVEPAKNPTFLMETYERTGSKGTWKLKKKAEKFSWENRGGEYDLTKI